ncbi:MAG: hypothetical protein R3336_09105, partial [Phycisphaeraceae bacterium]|nr:hypothetical protein [Phycisphaeraceae bacterium]
MSQIQSAQRGDDLQARAQALIPLVDRYHNTDVELKVIKTALIMALEFGDSRVIKHLRDVIARRFPGNYDLINFQRDQLGGQVFGAPFITRLEQVDGPPMFFPMDTIGIATGVYVWSKEGEGLDDVKELAAAWKKNKEEAAGQYRLVSLNVDDLPDGGKSILDELGVDWPVLKLPGGQNHPVYKTYGRRHPFILRVSPTGYAGIYLSSGRRHRGYERNFRGFLARSWSNPRLTSHLRSISSGEFLVVPLARPFDPAAPPELLAYRPDADPLPTGANDVPAATLEKIQACFVEPPTRYRLAYDQQLANYQKADRLCREAIAAHPDAANLWIVRNRYIVALMNLWKLTGSIEPFETAVEQALTVLKNDPPAGTEILARFCLARDALRNPEADHDLIIAGFVNSNGENAAPTLAAASLLALDVGRRPLHEKYRRQFLDQHASHPTLWSATTFFLNRHRRYWMYQPPFTHGWVFGRRWGHYIDSGTHEDAQRPFDITLKTLDGETVNFPEAADGKWTVIQFSQSAADHEHLRRYGAFAEGRPIDDVHRVLAVFNQDPQAVRQSIDQRKHPADFPTY